MTAERPVPRALVWATALDVLPLDSLVERRDGYLAVRSPSNPTHWFGNLLIFDEPPRPGDRPEWERLFEREFGDEPRVRHRCFGWDRPDGEAGALEPEFLAQGYELDDSIGLVATPEEVTPHERANREVIVRPLDPEPGGPDEQLWEGILELQVEARDERHPEPSYRIFSRARQDDLRAHFQAGHGAWYVALHPDDGELVATCGLVVTGTRGRYQAVDTAVAHRRKGICSRLVVEAARHAVDTYGADRFVIVADRTYHALGIYESLGFQRRERVYGVFREPWRD